MWWIASAGAPHISHKSIKTLALYLEGRNIVKEFDLLRDGGSQLISLRYFKALL